jgi:hypothetical protein
MKGWARSLLFGENSMTSPNQEWYRNFEVSLPYQISHRGDIFKGYSLEKAIDASRKAIPEGFFPSIRVFLQNPADGLIIPNNESVVTNTEDIIGTPKKDHDTIGIKKGEAVIVTLHGGGWMNSEKNGLILPRVGEAVEIAEGPLWLANLSDLYGESVLDDILEGRMPDGEEITVDTVDTVDDNSKRRYGINIFERCAIVDTLANARKLESRIYPSSEEGRMFGRGGSSYQKRIEFYNQLRQTLFSSSQFIRYLGGRIPAREYIEGIFPPSRIRSDRFDGGLYIHLFHPLNDTVFNKDRVCGALVRIEIKNGCNILSDKFGIRGESYLPRISRKYSIGKLEGVF